jgi:hypothetical protein
VPAPPAPPPPPVGSAPQLVAHPAPPPRRSRFFRRPAVVVLTATAAALTVTAAGFAWRAKRSGDEVGEMFEPGHEWGAAGMAAEARGRESEQIALVAAVGALVSGGIATWLAMRD